MDSFPLAVLVMEPMAPKILSHSALYERERDSAWSGYRHLHYLTKM